jgi:hypothetical protein
MFEVMDVYPKLVDEFRVQTSTGGAITVVGVTLMVVLFCGELSTFMSTTVDDRLSVDISIEEQLDITLNVTFPRVACKAIHLDLQDSAGHSRLDFHSTVDFTRIQVAEDGLMTKLIEEDTKAKGKEIVEGCNVAGAMQVAKLPGMFHFGVGTTLPMGNLHEHMFDLLEPASRNVSHMIHALKFGQHFPTLVNPLDGLVAKATSLQTGAFKYYVKVVRTVYEPLQGPPIISAQYSSTQYYSEADGMSPTVIFNYDVSPIMHKFAERKTSLVEFLVNSCAIIGGTFAVCGLVDSLLYHSRMDVVGMLFGRHDKLPT